MSQASKVDIKLKPRATKTSGLILKSLNQGLSFNPWFENGVTTVDIISL